MSLNNKNKKNILEKSFAESTDIIKNIIGNSIFSLIREAAADLFDETYKKSKNNDDLILPILAQALGGAMYILRTPIEEQQKWFDLVSSTVADYEKLDKELVKGTNEEHQSTLMSSFLKKVDKN